jgi:hypothetical protein
VKMQDAKLAAKRLPTQSKKQEKNCLFCVITKKSATMAMLISLALHIMNALFSDRHRVVVKSHLSKRTPRLHLMYNVVDYLSHGGGARLLASPMS